MLPVERFMAFVQQHQLFATQTPVLAALSGGMDSVLMAHLLKAAGCHFALAHCNFQLRGPEADAEQAFCRQLAQNWQVPFHTVNFDTAAYANQHKLSVQMAARELRYQWFAQLSKQHGYQCVALAHHQNDTIETLLLNLTRGTGIAGLHGILPKNGLWVRPLLFLTRPHITEIVNQNNLAYLEDSSNASTKYARNKIRHEVIPHLKALNPNLEQTFERNLAHFTQLEQLLQQQVAAARQALFTEKETDIYISLDGIRGLSPQHLLLAELLKPYGFNDTTVSNLITALPKHSGRVFESANYQLLLDRQQLILTLKKQPDCPPASVLPDTRQVTFGQYLLLISYVNAPHAAQNTPNKALVDADLLQFPLTLRTWQTGDSFEPLGMRGRKKLSDFFINQKVPLHLKTQIPLLINGNGDVVWVAGYRLDNRYKLTPQTKKVAIFELSQQL
jgi:tRNA(Ile)-lysidine synthase